MTVTLELRPLRVRSQLLSWKPPASPWGGRAGSSPVRSWCRAVTPAQFIAHMRIPRMTQPRPGHWLGVSLFAALFLCAAAGEAHGQEAVIRGRVIDDRGDALPVATVQVPELNVGV